jgi:predicted phosphodiesterase
VLVVYVAHLVLCFSAEVLQLYAEATGTPLLAVAGNVDDKLDAADKQLLPQHRLVQAAGWKLLVCHIVASGPTAKGKQTARRL